MVYAKTGSSLDLIPALVQSHSVELSVMVGSGMLVQSNNGDTSSMRLLKFG